MKREIAVFSFTIDGARDKALKLIGEDTVIEERMKLESGESPRVELETNKAIYRLYPHGTQMNGIRFHETHINDLFTVRYVNHIKQGLDQRRDMNSSIHYFMSDDKND